MRQIIFIFLFASVSNGLAQNKWAAGAMYYPGFLYAHTDDARPLEAHIHAIEISFAKTNNTDKVWNKYYKNAQIGYNFVYMDLGNQNLSGKVYALGTNFQFRIAGKSKNYLSARFGTGIAYITKKFDVYSNRKNMALGSHVNGNIQVALIYQTQLSSNTTLKTGVGITHYSNGSIKVPNLGINMPSLFLGFQTAFGNSTQIHTDTSKFYYTTKKRQEVLLNYGFKQLNTAKPITFHIISAGYRYIIPFNAIRRWHIGTDLVWDPTHPYAHDTQNQNPRVGIDNSTELTCLIGHRYDIGRFSMLTDIGFYILNPYKTKMFTYQRVGFRYEINNDFFLNASLKIHFGTADYFEWGIGYKFDKRKR